MLIEQSMRDIQTKLKDEIAQKVCFQKEAKDNRNLSKILEQENEQLQNVREELEIKKAELKHEISLLKTKLEKS